MVRKRKLDKGVTTFVDRHGKERARFRLKGMSCYLPHPSAPDYAKAYAQAMSGVVPLANRIHPKSIGDLVQRFYASNRFNAKAGEAWKNTVKQSLEPFRNEARDVPVADFTFEHIEVALARRAARREVDGKKFGGPAAAERFREQLIRLFDYAIRLKWITANPAREAEMPVTNSGKGYHTWTWPEIVQFRAKHPLGSKARLAMEIAFWTGLRRGDVARLGPMHVNDGRAKLVASKTGKTMDVEIAPEMLAAIEAMPEAGETFLITEQGKPFSKAGFGNWFRERCDEAGLKHCSIHGLRKALITTAADAGATQQELKALGQWSGDSEVAVYAQGIDRRMLADRAIRRVIERGTASNRPKKVRQNKRNSPNKSLDVAGAGG